MADINIVLKDPRPNVNIREIIVDPTTYYAQPGQTVNWTLSGRKVAFFTLAFPNEWPVSDKEVHSNGTTADVPLPISAPRKRHHYYVAVAADDGAGKPDIFVIAGCPEIIIR